MAIPFFNGLPLQHLGGQTCLQKLLGLGFAAGLEHPSLRQSLGLDSFKLGPLGLLLGHPLGFHRVAEAFRETSNTSSSLRF